jgi:YVTN family beta-propeller protein
MRSAVLRGFMAVVLLDGFSRAGAVGLAGVLVAAACCVGVSSAAAEGIIRTIPVGGHPWGVSSDGTHVWVANFGELFSYSEPVSEIDASSGTVIRTIPVRASGVGVSSDGTHVWVTNYDEEGTVSEIEPSSGTIIRTIPVGSYPYGVSSDGTDVWVTNDENTVNEIEPSSGTVIRTIPVGGSPWGVSSDGTDVWVTSIYEDKVREIEASSGTIIRTIPVGSYPYGVSSDGTHVWVANHDEDTVSEIEASSGTVIRTIPVGSGPLDVSSDGTHIWVANATENTVSEIEASSGTVIDTISVGSGPVGVSSDGTHVWVSNYGEDTISEIPTSYLPAPKASIEAPVGGWTYLQGVVVKTKFSCTEGKGGPGLESCTDSNGGSGNSGVLETSTLGPHSYTVTANSKDEETDSASIGYTVVGSICTGDTGTITLSPGLTDTAAVQTIKIKGTLTGCSGQLFTGAKYTTTLKTAGSVSCSVLTGAGETATGAARYKLTPKRGTAKPSTGTISMPLTETPGVAFSAEVTNGSYSPLTLAGIATENYTAATTCGGKAAKPVKKGTFRGVISAFNS